MPRRPDPRCLTLCWCLCFATVGRVAEAAEDPVRIDYLSLAQGVIPVAFEGDAKDLRLDRDQALLAIDGNDSGFVLTPGPGSAASKVSIIYKLPALTTFSEFAVPNVLETPSPSQTFVRGVEIAGSAQGPQGPFEVLASDTLTTHPEKGQTTILPAMKQQAPVRWVRVTLEGGIDIQRDKTFLEFSEIIGYGTQEPVPLSAAFGNQWKGRGVLLDLQQDGVRVTGCYDGEGDLNGIVSGNVLRATGSNRKSGVPSLFVLVAEDGGRIIGVRSTNGAPFRIYSGDAAPGIRTECSAQPVRALGCGSIIHGIQFDFDSAAIRQESTEVVDALSSGLTASTAAAITVIGHTSSEGSDGYNDDLSRRRAQSVVAAIVARGIEPGRVSAEGRGEKQPIADNTTEAGRSMNRRVEIACP